MKKSERINDLARKYAMSGKFESFLLIEMHIRFVDYLPEARAVLDNSYIRDELRRLIGISRSQ